jgi:hypothetical protein
VSQLRTHKEVDFARLHLALRSLLESWPYDAENNLRVARDADRHENILARQPMGVEQYEIDGRPDGRRVHGMESVFDFHQARINAAKQSNALIGLDLSAEDCAELFDESVLYHNRLLLLFRLKDWTRVERDAAHILRLIEFIKQHARCEEDRVQLHNWRPDIARINAVAQAMVLLEKSHYQDALKLACGTVGISEAVADDGPDRGKLAEALLESVRESLANRPALRMHEESLFLQHDDYWMIRYHGHAALLRSTRGLHCLALLLRYPGREFHVGELLAPLVEKPFVSAAGRHTSVAWQGRRLYDAGPILDPWAKTEYKRRIDDLRRDLEEAEQFNDPDRAARARNEMDAIVEQLASAVGLGGRDRKSGSEAERARSAVTKRIKEAINRIADVIPPLGRHLATRIKTGYFCSYTPHPDRPVAWKF